MEKIFAFVFSGLIVLILSCSNRSTVVDSSNDIQPPLGPENLHGYGTSSSTIRLYWDDKSDIEDGFVIKRLAPLQDSFIVCGNVGTNVVTFEDRGLDPNTHYMYSVQATFDGILSNTSSLDMAGTLDRGITLVYRNSEPRNDYGITVSGDFAFLYGGDSIMHVVDIAQPQSPILGPDYHLNEDASRFVVDGDFIFASTEGNGYGIRIFDKSDPYNIIQTSAIENSCFFDAAINDSLVYFSSMPYGLRTYNISNPAFPVLIEEFWTDNYYQFDLVELYGTYAYASTYDDKLLIIDIANPVSDSLVGFLPYQGIVQDLLIKDNYLFIANYPTGLFIYNIINPISPVFVGLFSTQEGAIKIKVFGNIAYVLDNSRDLHILSLANLSSPNQVAFYDGDIHYGIVDIDTDSSFIYIADYEGLSILRYDPAAD